MLHKIKDLKQFFYIAAWKRVELVAASFINHNYVKISNKEMRWESVFNLVPYLFNLLCCSGSGEGTREPTGRCQLTVGSTEDSCDTFGKGKREGRSCMQWRVVRGTIKVLVFK